jgi:hypothetical protein
LAPHLVPYWLLRISELITRVEYGDSCEAQVCAIWSLHDGVLLLPWRMGWSSRKSLLPEGNVTSQATLQEFLDLFFCFTFLSLASRVNEAVGGRGSGFRFW